MHGQQQVHTLVSSTFRNIDYSIVSFDLTSEEFANGIPHEKTNTLPMYIASFLTVVFDELLVQMV